MKFQNLVIQNLAKGVITLNSMELPDRILNIAKRCLVDISGVTIAGASTKSAQMMFDIASECYATGNCNLLGHSKLINTQGAAFANGAAAHSLDYDDNCYAGIVHGSAVIFPAVLAFAQQNALTGSDLLKGFITGLEIEFSVAKALSNDIYNKGWWTTSVLGSIGSAAGVASLARLKNEEIENALSLAIVGVGATRAVRGTNAKHYYCGRAAESGVMAVYLAMKGGTGPTDVFEDRNGILSVINDKNFDDSYIKDIGIDFGMTNPGIDIKKYPVCYASHSAADGIKSIIRSNNILIENIDSIICKVPPIIASNLTYSKPKTVKEAQFSIEFPIASIIKYGDICLEHLKDSVILNDDMQSLMKKVKMRVSKIPKNQESNNKICPEWSNVELYTKNGECHEAFVGAPLGSSIKPITDETLYNKFASCLKFSDSFIEPKDLYEKLIKIETVNNVQGLFS